MNKNPEQWISEAAFLSIFGIERKKLRALGIEPKVIDGETCYPLDTVVTRCQTTIKRVMAKRANHGASMSKETLTLKRLQEDVLKLRDENDATEAALVDRQAIIADYAEKVDAVKSIISDIPKSIVEARPDIDPKAVKIVRSEIDKAINNPQFETLKLG